MKLKRKYYLPHLSKPTFIKGIAVFLFLFSFSLQGQTVSILSDTGASETGPTNGSFTVFSSVVVNNIFGLTVNYSVSGTATPVDDYTQLSGTVTIPFGSTTAIIPVLLTNVNDDNLVEGNEDVTVTIEPGGYFIGFSNEATITIADNDIGTISLNLTSPPYDPDAAEAGLDPGLFRIDLSNPNATSATVTVNYSISGTATDGTDFTLGNAVSLTFANNGTTVARNLSVNPIQDFIIDPNETVTLTLDGTSNPALFPIGLPNTATVTIADDDVAGVNVTPIVGTTSESGTSADFLFTLTSQPIADVTIPTNGYNATEHTGPASVVLTSVNWNTGVTLTVTGLDDAIVDGDVTYNLNTGNVTSPDPFYDALVNADVPQINLTNLDDDIASVNVTTISGPTTEAGGIATFTVTLGTLPTAAVTIALTSSDLTEGTVPASVTLTTLNWDIGVDVTVTGVDDGIVDGNVAYTINTGNVTSTDPAYNALNVASVADVAVTNNDDDSFIATISATDDTATEAGGLNNGEFTVDLGAVNGTGSDIVVSFTRSGTATHVTDYANIGTSVSIANGQQTGTVTINPVDDALVEGPETVILTLASGASYTVGAPNNATVNIVDNDSFTASIAATDDTATEGGAANNGEFTVDLGAVNGTGSPIVVNFNRSGTATHVTDYANIGTSVSIANGQLTNTIIINPVNDVVVEGQETVILTLASGAGYTVGAPNNATVNIVDNDSAGYTLSTTTLSTSENGINGTFTVVLTAAPASNVVISATSEDTSEGTIFPATLTFTPGNFNIAQPITVTPVDDLAVDGPVSYNVALSVVDASSDDNFDPLADQTVTVTNADDDVASLSISDAAVNENVAGGNLFFDVVLSHDISGGTTVNYTFNDGSATGGGVDYDSSSGSITFIGVAGEIQQIVVPINDDSNLENSEDFSVQLGTPTNGVIILGGSSATGTINDDDNCAPAPILNPDVSTFFCDVIDASLNTYTNSTPPAGTVLTWSTLSDPLNTNAHLSAADVANPPNDGSYFGFFFDAANDCASGTIEVELTLNPIPFIAETMGDERCGPGEVILTANGAPDVDEPPTFNWYDSPTGFNLIGTGPSISLNITTTTSYYVEATANGCPSDREEVTAIIHPLPSAGTPSNASACSIAANGPTIVDLDDLLTGESTGAWSVTTDPSGTMSIGIGNIVNFENRATGDYIFTFTTTDATVPFCDNVSSEVIISVNDCDVDTDLDGLLDGLEITLGTDPNNADTDGDGIEDAVEVGDDTANPLDEDSDGIIDALDSNILDTDMDGVVDQLDPANMNPCVPDPSSEFCVATVDLEIIKTANDDFLNVNEQLTFTITVTNISEEIATMIQVEEVLDAVGFDYISHFTGPGDGVYDEVAGLWDIPMLEPNASATVVILVEAISFGVYVNTATILGSSPVDIDLENNESSVEIEVNERSNNECGFLFNQFSPNGDGTNDFLVINCITNPEYADNSLDIYDRYGNQVYATRGYDNTWNGTRNNNDLPKGTYFYVLDLGDGSEISKGWIQIIRQ